MTAVVHAGSFVNGAIAMGFAIAGLHFLRFQRDTGDRLFVFFAAAFWVLAAERVGLLVVGPDEAARTSVYVARLIAFALIIAGVVDKNRRQ